MLTYRRVWIRVTSTLVGAGLAVLTVLIIVVAPWLAGVVLATTALVRVLSRRGAGRRPRQPGLRAVWDACDLDVRLGLCLPVVLLATVGLELIVGFPAVQLMLLDMVAGLPLIFDRTPGPDRVPVEPDGWTVEVLLGPTAPGAAAKPDGPNVPRPRSPGVDAALERSVDALFDPAAAASAGGVARDRPGLVRLSNLELRHAWRASYRALRIAEDPRDRMRIAAARARYLDALQERDPEGFARWVHSEDAASLDPGPFLGSDPPSPA